MTVTEAPSSAFASRAHAPSRPPPTISTFLSSTCFLLGDDGVNGGAPGHVVQSDHLLALQGRHVPEDALRGQAGLLREGADALGASARFCRISWTWVSSTITMSMARENSWSV